MQTNEITTVYTLSTNGFKTEKDVLNSYGYEELKVKIGNGTYGTVWKTKNFKNGILSACKKIDLVKGSKRIRRNLETNNQLFALEKISHLHGIRLYEHFIIDDSLYIFMQFIVCGRFGHNFRQIRTFS